MTSISPDAVILTKFASLIPNGRLDVIKSLLVNLSFENQLIYNGACMSFADGLITFCRLEKNYHNLQIFPTKSLFSRKEDYAASYDGLQAAFEILRGCSTIFPQHTEYRAADIMANYCAVRHALIKIYRSLASYPSKLLKELESVRSEVERLEKRLAISDDDEVAHALNSYSRVIRAELVVLSTLLQIQSWIADLQYIDPLNAFFTVSSELKLLFTTFCPQNSSSWVRTFSLFPSFELPALTSWLTSFYQLLLAKYSVYWFKILSHSVFHRDLILNVVNQESPSLVNKILKFQRTANAIHLSVFFDTSCQDYPFLGHGYVVRGTVGQSPQGIESIPPIFTAPLGYEVPTAELSTIFVLAQTLKLEEVGKSVYSFDVRLGQTYFVRKIEYRYYLVLVFEGHRHPNDKQITNFINFISTHVSLQAVCTALQSR